VIINLHVMASVTGQMAVTIQESVIGNGYLTIIKLDCVLYEFKGRDEKLIRCIDFTRVCDKVDCLNLLKFS
jgi:hypothetical protein